MIFWGIIGSIIGFVIVGYTIYYLVSTSCRLVVKKVKEIIK